MLHGLFPDPAVNGSVRTPGDLKSTVTSDTNNDDWVCTSRHSTRYMCGQAPCGCSRLTEKSSLMSAISIIVTPNTLGYTSTLSRLAQEFSSTWSPPTSPVSCPTLWSGPCACSSPWPQPSWPPRFCSHCSLHRGHSFSPLLLENSPELPGLLFMSSDAFVGLLWQMGASVKALGALCPYSFHLWALASCWPLPLHRKFSGNAERWILGCLRL